MIQQTRLKVDPVFTDIPNMHKTIALLALTVACKTQGPGANVSPVKTAKRAALGLALIETSTQDLYAMSKAQLQQVPPSILENEIVTLQTRNTAEQKDLTNIQAFNLAMCKRLQLLQTKCVAQLYLTNDINDLVNLHCVDASVASTQAPPTVIQPVITVPNATSTFVLIANDVWVSDPFTSATNTPVQFHNNGAQVITPPRFRQLQSLTLVAIAPGGNANTHVPIPAISSIQLKILLNGTPFLGDPATGYVTLVAPSDPSNTWAYLVNPAQLLTVGQTPACNVTLQELQTMQANSMVAK